MSKIVCMIGGAALLIIAVQWLGGSSLNPSMDETGTASVEDAQISTGTRAVPVGSNDAAVASPNDQKATVSPPPEKKISPRTEPLIATERSGEMSGVVFSSTNMPVANAQISVALDGYPDEVLTETTSDEGGSFQLTRLPVGPTTLRLSVRADGYSSHQRSLAIPPNEPSLLGVEIRLQPTRSLSGTVVDEGGQPVAGAWVWHRRDRHLQTDPRGEFRFPALPLGEATAWAWKPGFAIAQRHLSETAESTRLTLIRESPSKVVVDVLSAEGRALPNTPIYFSTQLPLNRVQSDASGRFETMLPAGAYSIKVVAPGFFFRPLPPWKSDPDYPGECSFDCAPGETLEIKFQQVLGQEIEGQVRRRSGEPVAGIALLVESLWHQSECRTDSMGRFRTSLRPEAETVEVSIPGEEYACLFSQHIVNAARFDLVGGRSLDVTAVELAIVRGRVESRQGQPVIGVTVAPAPRKRGVGGVQTDRAGRFTLRGVLPVLDPKRARKVVAQCPAGRGEMEIPSLEEGAELGEVVIVLDPHSTGEISGRVRLEGGSGIGGVRVEVVKADALMGFVEKVSGTAADGRFRVVGLKPGTYRLAALYDGTYHALPSAFEIREGQSVSEVEIVVSSLLEISGRVLSSAGDPVPGAEVSAEPQGARSERESPWGSPPGHYTRADSSGAFRLRGLEPGRYRISANEGLFGDWTIGEAEAHLEQVEAGTTDLVMRLEPEGRGTIRGELHVPPRRGLEGAISISLERVDSGLAAEATVGFGQRQPIELELDGVVPGEYWLELGRDDIETARVKVHVLRDEITDVGTLAPRVIQ